MLYHNPVARRKRVINHWLLRHATLILLDDLCPIVMLNRTMGERIKNGVTHLAVVG